MNQHFSIVLSLTLDTSYNTAIDLTRAHTVTCVYTVEISVKYTFKYQRHSEAGAELWSYRRPILLGPNLRGGPIELQIQNWQKKAKTGPHRRFWGSIRAVNGVEVIPSMPMNYPTFIISRQNISVADGTEYVHISMWETALAQLISIWKGKHQFTVDKQMILHVRSKV